MVMYTIKKISQGETFYINFRSYHDDPQQWFLWSQKGMDGGQSIKQNEAMVNEIVREMEQRYPNDKIIKVRLDILETEL